METPFEFLTMFIEIRTNIILGSKYLEKYIQLLSKETKIQENHMRPTSEDMHSSFIAIPA